MRKALCEYKYEHPSSSQRDFCNSGFNKHLIFLLANQQYQVIKYLSKEIKNNNVKRHKSAKYPELEKVLYERFLQYQEKVNMTREMIQTKAKEFLQKMYGDANFEFNFSIGWLERFKARHGIKDIYNMDESGLFYRLQADHSLATKQLEGRKMDKERLIVVVCCNEDGSDKMPLWVIDNNSVLPHVSLKKAFLTVDILKNYLIQHEKNILVKDKIVFDSHAEKKQLTIDAYFSKE
ncbi:hypothetical protein CXB51_016969 [Gossypium anomalum]|uniref:HTH CENPB-type domain-containing protein n=1 Tax=Gossypium anomalum TaxID=47600 RepID=A0A8J5YMY0_9ROSI|nr:hypothetical protein CXB51_016969 [Gossypium anomalum]